MAENFNPYQQWLGLDPAISRPNYYQLLGVSTDQRDAAQIAAAAERALSKVRGFRPGAEANQWARLLDEINAAKRCLSDPGKRAEYNEQLKNPSTEIRTAGARPAPRATAGFANAMYPPGMSPPSSSAPSPSPPSTAASSASAASPASPQIPQALPTAASTSPAPVPQSPPSQPLPAATAKDNPMSAFGQVPVASPAAGQPAGMPDAGNVPAAIPQVPNSIASPVPVASPLPVGSPMPAAPSSAAPVARMPVGSSVENVAAPAAAVDPMAAFQATPATAADAAGFAPSGGSPLPDRQTSRDRSVSKQLKKKNKQSKRTPLLLLGGGSMLGLILIVVLAALGGKDDDKPSNASSQLAQSQVDPAQSPRGNPPQSRPIPQAAPSNIPQVDQNPPTDTSSPDATDEPQPLDTTADDPEEMIEPESVADVELPPFGDPPPFGGPMDQPDATPDQSGTASDPVSETKPMDPAITPPTTDPTTPPTKPEPTNPRPSQPETARPTGKPSDADIDALAAAMKAARTALGEYRFADANAELEKARSLPMLPEHMELFDRLDLTSQYAENFRSALKQSVAMLDGGDDIEVGSSTVVGVVEKTNDSITIRLAGMNRTYKFDDLPEGLAVGIADKGLDKDDPVTLVMKAAYLATLANPRQDRLDRARQWFQEAAAKDPEIGNLEQVIDDSYDLKKPTS